MGTRHCLIPLHLPSFFLFKPVFTRYNTAVGIARRMAKPVNRKRTRKPKEHNGRSLWGSLLQHNEEEEEEILPLTPPDADEDDETAAPQKGLIGILRQVWKRFNFWASVAVALFLSFAASLLFLLIELWRPQDLNDIQGYADSMPARDLEALIRNANGGPVTITEEELNRYLRETCRMRQPGIFSIITHCQGVAVRLHNGYAEIIFDRVLGANIHQTTAVNLTFRQELKLGLPELHADMHGGEPLLGSMPNGGSIGNVPLPRRYVVMLGPALDSLISCYPGIVELMNEHHYCPVFSVNGTDRRITLIPYTAS